MKCNICVALNLRLKAKLDKCISNKKPTPSKYESRVPSSSRRQFCFFWFVGPETALPVLPPCLVTHFSFPHRLSATHLARCALSAHKCNGWGPRLQKNALWSSFLWLHEQGIDQYLFLLYVLMSASRICGQVNPCMCMLICVHSYIWENLIRMNRSENLKTFNKFLDCVLVFLNLSWSGGKIKLMSELMGGAISDCVCAEGSLSAIR